MSKIHETKVVRNMMQPFFLACTFAWALIALGSANAEETNDALPAIAQTLATDDTVGNCVRTNRIRRTRILDDQTIILDMAGGDNLVMHLKYRCPQLSFHDFFSYEPTLGQLCAELDHIVTRAGFHCDIGSFSLYKDEDKAKS